MRRRGGRGRSRAHAWWHTSPFRLARVAPWRLIGLFDEDEGGPLHNRSAGANEGDLDIFHLAFPRTFRRLQGPLNNMPQPMDAPGAQAPPEGVQGQRTLQLDASVLHEIQRFALLTEPVGLQAVDDRGGKAVIDLGHIDLFEGETGALPGEAC